VNATLTDRTRAFVLRWGRLLVPILCIGFAVAFLINIREMSFEARSYPMGAAVLLIGLALLNGYLVVVERDGIGRAPDREDATYRDFIRIGFLLLLLISFTVGIVRLGPYTSTGLMMLLGGLILGERRPRVLLPVSLGVAFGAWVIFSQVLQVPLPRTGILI